MSNLSGVNYRMEWMGWYVPERAVEQICGQIQSASLAAHRAWCDVVLPLLPPHYPWDGTPAGAIEALVIHTRKTSGTPMTLKQAIEVCKASNDAREEFVERPSDAPKTDPKVASDVPTYKKLVAEVDWLRGIVRQIAATAEKGRGLVP